MTRDEFDQRQAVERCRHCGGSVVLEHNPNNNAQQVICGSCASRTPWTLVINIKQNTTKTRRDPLPDGQTLDDVWDRWDNICFVCGAPKTALMVLGIGRECHHVLPYAQHGHQGPIVPICKLCHPVVTERQRLYWFMQRLVSRSDDEPISHSGARVSTSGVSRHPVRAAREAPVGAVEGLPNNDADE